MPEIHAPLIELSSPLPTDVEAGTELTLEVRVTCPSGCDLTGESVQVLTADGSVVTVERVSPDAAERVGADTMDSVGPDMAEAVIPDTAEVVSPDTAETGSLDPAERLSPHNEVEILSLRAPREVGEHTWTILLPAHEMDGVLHEEASLDVSTTVRPHETSVAVWDVATPVVIGEAFGAKIGIRCSAECGLTGNLVEVCDETGARVGEGVLGEDPWPGTQALYWAEVLLDAPPSEGGFTWSAGPVEADFGPSHVPASAVVSVRTVGPPEHTVEVEVVRDDTGDPIDKVEVRMGIYRASTDERGMARFELPSGEFDLVASKAEFAADPVTVEVTGDLKVRIEARYEPPPDPDEERIWM